MSKCGTCKGKTRVVTHDPTSNIAGMRPCPECQGRVPTDHRKARKKGGARKKRAPTQRALGDQWKNDPISPAEIRRQKGLE